ncbi:hypothetical protein ANO14919_046690 [Xylariales sp. No.14919]|nr:hypothetical protein ANO14919_046690 [Xylariales sp. No.14919]
MADADYFLDLSSPDPLAEDAPSSARPASRRITKSQQDLTSFSIPRSSPQRQSRALSPRKRTFQLDVGDERSPQRIRVTVEAEETLKHDAINRKLFPPQSSPTKSPRCRENITTTVVPLNDEPEVSTPRKRGRQRRTSNGTPMPRGRKRAGTPIRRKSKQARLEDEPSSEAGVLEGPSIDKADGGEETPKPTTKARRTPRKLAGTTPVPSSQVSSSTTGRKRGRPRKVPVPEDPTALNTTRPQPSRVATSSPPALESNIQNGSDKSVNMGRDGSSHGQRYDDNANPILSSPKEDNSTTRPVHINPPRDLAGVDRSSASPASSHQSLAENDDFIMSEDYQAMEPQSDLQSAEDEDGITHHGQDTIADASDFSMIAVESLPSFQASFQASFREDAGKPASDEHEMGEETSRIINETLDSLRRSLNTEKEGSLHSAEAPNDLTTVEGHHNEDRDETQEQLTVTTNHENRRSFLSSPRRPKQLPLSRQVFVGRGQVDDSFSSIPDSILHAATPGRLPVQPTAGEYEHQGGEDGPYEDSFSEIPEAILEAATPRPMRRVERSTREPLGENEQPHQITHSTGRRSSLDHRSSRLPTPEATSSSNAGSRKAREEDTAAELEPQDQSDLAHRTDMPSSPPIRTRPRALDFGYSNLQHELNVVQERLSSSPQRQQSIKNAPNQFQSLEAPLPSARPSLSPIVRVGRTLQNVMSDNSSPEAREGNLGSPFRGSASSDYPHQSIVAGSSSPSLRKRRVSGQSQLSAGPSTRLDRNSRSNMGRDFGRALRNSGETEDPPAPENIINSRIEPLQYSTSQQPSDSVISVHTASVNGSTNMNPPSANEERSWATRNNNSQPINRRQPSFQTASSYVPGTVGTRTASAVEATTADDTYSHPKQDGSFRDEPVQDMDEDLSDRLEEHVDDDDDDDVDIWDIEASRTSPGKLEPPQATLKALKSDVPSSRRSKVPSPWRRNNRRLIYKDDIASSSQIEIEESSQSEVEQNPPVRPKQRPPVTQTQQDTQRRPLHPESAQKDLMQEDLYRRENTTSPNPSHDNFGEYGGLADSDESEDMEENEEPAPLQQPQGALDPIYEDFEGYEEHEEYEEHEAPEALDVPTVPETSADASEYSLVARQAKQTPQEQKKRKSGFFGGFDILSFFSSPAVLPTNQPPGPNPPGSVNKPAIPQPTLEAREPKEPPRALWSTGLFPSMPKTEANSRPGQRTDLSSPGPALRSTDTVADTYEPSTSASLSPSRSPSASVAPSTPERPNFPPIEQKRNFTPRPGLLRGSLFAPSEANSTVQGEDHHGFQESSDEQESSALTETSEYERVPPREKPSRWDRHLSPTKSSFRSPLKPTTPGRIVAFSNNALAPLAPLAPLAQPQARNALHNSTNGRNTLSQGFSARPTFEGKENQPYHYTQQIRNANDNYLDETTPKVSTASREIQQSHAVAFATESTSVALSQTTWSKQHWTRLDDMLQLRRHEPLRFQQLCALPPPDERRSSVLLGKEVAAQDAHLILEPWHLEVVEAFKLEVGGWDERVLAKRLFALVIGEERRQAGTAP